MNNENGTIKISVCVATYNQSAYIKECLLSVLMQTCDAEMEILVGDDCSADQTCEIVREVESVFPGRLTLVQRKRNLGPTKNYQDLIACATGDYIAHLDGDDFWMPGKLTEQIEFLRLNQDCSAVYSNAIIINEEGNPIGIFNNPQPALFDTDYLLGGGNFLNHSSILYRAKFKYLITELNVDFIDYRVHLRMSSKGKLGYINKKLVSYRIGSQTSMIKNEPDKVMEQYWEALSDTEIKSFQKTSLIRGKAFLWSVLLATSIVRCSPSFAIRWAGRIKRETPNKAISIFIIGTLRCFGSLVQNLINKISHTLKLNSLPVYYLKK